MQINKLDAARRQLLAAIHLHWYLLEPIASYQLAANAAEICDSLLKRMGKIRVRERLQEVHNVTEDDVRRMINAPRNFTKHADVDPDAFWADITSEDADAMVMTASIDYCVIAGRSHHSIGIFVAWYAAVYPEKTGDFALDAAQALFPDLVMKPRATQVAAAREVMCRDLPPVALHDSRNDLTDNWRWNSLRKLGKELKLPL